MNSPSETKQKGEAQPRAKAKTKRREKVETTTKGTEVVVADEVECPADIMFTPCRRNTTAADRLKERRAMIIANTTLSELPSNARRGITTAPRRRASPHCPCVATFQCSDAHGRRVYVRDNKTMMEADVFPVSRYSGARSYNN